MAGRKGTIKNREKLDFKNKRVLVMGLGLHGGGVGAVKFFAASGARVTVTDLRTKKELAPSLRALSHIRGITYVLGQHRVSDFRAADLIIKNPGVRRDNAYLSEAARAGIPITSDLGIFFDACPTPIIGITGTRSKSTTAYLIWKFLSAKYPRVFLAGNIRKSVLEILPKIRKGDFVVLELSSFQLADLDTEKKSPSVALITNIMQDHLNWHTGMREYREAKATIFRHQRRQRHSDILENVGMSGVGEDVLIIPAGDAKLAQMARRAPSRVIVARLPANLQKIVGRNLGEHYRVSVALAVAAAKIFAVSGQAIERSLGDFHGLPERQEEIAVKKGIHFIDDTTATTPDAAIAAIRRFRKKAGARRLILIAGGSDKKLRFGDMIRVIKKSADAVIVLPGSATEKIKKAARDTRHGTKKILLHEVKSMREAVQTAWRLAKKGDYILLSPGAASFGLFLNEFDRGSRFQNEVKKYNGTDAICG